MEELSLTVIIVTIYFGLYYQAGAGDPIMESEPVSWMIFICVLTPSIAFAISFGKIMWIEVLKVVAKKSARLFRYLTCGSRNITEFKLQYFDDDESDANNASLDDDVQEED